jgi:hypothetical protein
MLIKYRLSAAIVAAALGLAASAYGETVSSDPDTAPGAISPRGRAGFSLSGCPPYSANGCLSDG